MKKLISLIAILFIFSTSLTQADFSANKWQFKKAIGGPASGVGFGELTFDADVLGGARPDLADIRVIKNGEEEVPYVLANETPRTQVETYPVQMINKGVVPGRTTQFTADLGREGVLHNEIDIKVDSFRSKNFRRSAQVEGSRDGISWVTLATKSIYDYTVEFVARDTSIAYQESTYRYVRVTIFDNGEEPLVITGATVRRETQSRGKEVAYNGAITERVTEESERAEQTTFDVGARGLPTNRIAFETGDVNFNREIAFEGSNDGKAWTAIIYRDVLFSYDTPKFKGSKLELAYGNANYRYFRLTVFNKDNAPIKITKGTLFGFVWKAVFSYNPVSSYALHYGNSGARRPEYDLENYLAYFDADSRVSLSLGSQVENKDFAPDVPFVPFSERYAWFLNFALFVAVIIVGSIAIGVIRRK